MNQRTAWTCAWCSITYDSQRAYDTHICTVVGDFEPGDPTSEDIDAARNEKP